jgi:hypothetical protein
VGVSLGGRVGVSVPVAVGLSVPVGVWVALGAGVLVGVGVEEGGAVADGSAVGEAVTGTTLSVELAAVELRRCPQAAPAHRMRKKISRRSGFNRFLAMGNSIAALYNARTVRKPSFTREWDWSAV